MIEESFPFHATPSRLESSHRSSTGSNPHFDSPIRKRSSTGSSSSSSFPPRDDHHGFHDSNSQQESNRMLASSNSWTPQQPYTHSKRLSLDSRAMINNFKKDFGLLITLHRQSDGTSRCELRFTPDSHITEIHPNAYAPKALTNLSKLGGGGSGVSVFQGKHPEFGDLVMKHGGDKDLKELFALAEIHQELLDRGQNYPHAAQDLQSKIPEFRMIYVSPHHLGEKRRELWYRLSHMYKHSARNLMANAEKEEALEDNMPDIAENDESIPEDKPEDSAPLKTRRQRSRTPHIPNHIPTRNGLNMTGSGTVSGHRDIAVYSNSHNKECSVELLGDSLTLSIPECDEVGDGLFEPIVIPGDGYAALASIVKDLLRLMKDHKWKFTLAQKRIGGNDPKTGNMWLYSGQLEGKLLDNLIAQKIKLVKDLVELTLDEEKSPKHLRAVREEVVRFEEEEDITPGDISSLSDTFVGNAIKKNFQKDGRFEVMIQLGKQFRFFSLRNPKFRRLNTMSGDESDHSSREAEKMTDADMLVLTPEEEIPAHHLGNLLRSGALMGDTFEKVPFEPTVLEMNQFYWRTVLRAAVKPREDGSDESMAMTRLWTCGLADAGVHNLFISESRLWLFDLGQPQLYSVPGFLTKFLFSFFHTLGMEETPDGDSWVRRFEHSDLTRKLRMTAETETLLAKAYDAFEVTMDRLIEDLFDGDDSLRWLLIQYVTLQLISDASFCLQRWTIKGGGLPRDSNHQTGIEKWLWRAIWDMFVAFDINTNDTWTRLYVEHPSYLDENFFAAMRDLMSESEHSGSEEEQQEN